MSALRVLSASLMMVDVFGAFELTRRARNGENILSFERGSATTSIAVARPGETCPEPEIDWKLRVSTARF